MAIICTTFFNIQTLCILPTQCIYVFYMVLAVNCHYFPKQHQPIVLCDGDAVLSLWCAIWFLISYLNQRQSSIDRTLAQAFSRRSAPRRSGSTPGQSECLWSAQSGTVRRPANDPYCCPDQKKQTKPVTDIREQWTEMYLRRMDFTGLIRLPCPVLRAVIMQFCTTGWSVSWLPSWVLVLPAMPLPHTL